jgi:chorismate-pyruvate lyase
MTATVPARIERSELHRSLRRILRTGCAALLLAIGAGCASPAPRAGDRLERAELLALLQTLNADLLGHDSATLTLERWCADHRLADPARIVARRARGADKALPDALRAKLAIGPAEAVGYRHVELACGDRVLSEADNWYVPGRLTAEMNLRLDTTDEPFGKVVAALHFQRRTLSAQLLWSPLPAGWELAADSASDAGALRVPHRVLRHEAILYDAAQVPFSAVVETYTNAVFGFGRWRERLE